MASFYLLPPLAQHSTQLPPSRSGVAAASRAARRPLAPAASSTGAAATAMVRTAAPSGQGGAALHGLAPGGPAPPSTFKHIYTGSLAHLANHRTVLMHLPRELT